MIKISFNNEIARSLSLEFTRQANENLWKEIMASVKGVQTERDDYRLRPTKDWQQRFVCSSKDFMDSLNSAWYVMDTMGIDLGLRDEEEYKKDDPMSYAELMGEDENADL